MKKWLSLIVCALFAIEGKAQICFNPDTNYQVGVFPCSITTNDFNNDGFPDLATANHFSNNVSILLNQGGLGTFTWVANYPVGADPLWITSADYDQDGSMDIATANEGSHSASVIFGPGIGTTTLTALTFPVRFEGSSACSGDLNGDGFPDLAITIAHYDSVDIRLSDGAGNFILKGYYDTGAGGEPDAVYTYDLNEDGNLDLLVGNWGGFISVLLGDGTGAFGAPTIYNTTGNKPTCAVAADFNGDGHLDIAASNYFSQNISLLPGDGLGNFGPCTNFPIGGIKPYTLWAEDFNGDGNTDIVTPNEGSANISVILGDGLGNFGAPAVFLGGTNPEQAISGDWNQDGMMDIAVANFGSNNVTVLLNAPLPLVTVSASADTVCAGNQVTLYGGGVSTYTWSNGVSNGVSFTASATTTYSVMGTDSLGCTNWDSLTVTVNICTGVENDALAFNIYPNPARDIFVLENRGADVETIQLFDHTGKLIWSRKQQAKEMIVETLGLDGGIYDLLILGRDSSFTKKLVIEK